MKFALVNESTQADLVKDRILAMAGAYAIQLGRDFASLFQTQPTDFDVIDVDALPLYDENVGCVCHYVDRIPEAPDALAYHTRNAKGRPVVRIGVFTALDFGLTLKDVEESGSHEVLEAWWDPYANGWTEFDGKKKVAQEVCDAVQGSGYDLGGVQVANFVSSRWFDGAALGEQFDFRKVLTAPLTRLSTGYLAFDDGTQDLGEKIHPAKLAQIMKYSRVAQLRKKAA